MFKKLNEFKPSKPNILGVALYSVITKLMVFGTFRIKKLIWAIPQLVISIYVLVHYGLMLKDRLPDWKMGKYWLITLMFFFPINILWYLWSDNNSFLLILALFLAHSAVILWILPLHLSIGFFTTILLMYISLVVCIDIPLFLLSANRLFLLPQLGLGLLIFSVIIESKFQISIYLSQYIHLKNQQKILSNRRLRKLTYNLAVDSLATHNNFGKKSIVIEHIIEYLKKSIEFLEKNPLYKQSYQAIVNNFPEWSLFLKRQVKSKDHMLLFPTEEALDTLIDQITVALKREALHVFRLVVKTKDQAVPSHIVCDLNQSIRLLVVAILRVDGLDCVGTQYVKIHFHTTYLQYQKHDFIANHDPSFITVPAIAVVISSSTTHPVAIPKVQSYYNYQDNIVIDDFLNQCFYQVAEEKYIDFNIKSMERIVHAHYGYLEVVNRCAILMVLPCNVAAVREEMFISLSRQSSSPAASIASEEEDASMQALTTFHHHICQISYVDSGVIAEILLLLRRCYGFQRHPSGKLFYLRAIGIAELVAEWRLHTPRFIYATLLYDLIRFTSLPFAYIKANYDWYIVSLVAYISSMHTYQSLMQPLLDVHNCCNDTVNPSRFAVLYIKFAERLYDLRHVQDYSSLDKVKVKHMAQEVLSVDVILARRYFKEAKIAEALTHAAQNALAIC